MPSPLWLRWFDDPRVRRALPWICGVIAAWIAVKNLVGGYGDLGIYLDAAREFRAGGIDLYRVRPGTGPWAYPPFALLPFASLQLVANDAAVRWTWCSLLGVGTALLLTDLARAVRPLGGLAPSQWVVFGVLFQRVFAQNMTHGQLSLWVGVLVARGVVELQRGRDARAGRWLGIAAAMKLTPLLFLVALPFLRRPRVAAWLLATVVIAVFVAPWPFCGTQEHLRHLGDFARFLASSGDALGPHAGPSVAGTFDYLLQARPMDKEGHLANVLDVGDGALLAVKILWSSLLAVLLFAWCWRVRKQPDPVRLCEQSAAVALAACLFSPLVRTYHLAGALLPFALFCRGPRDRRDWLWFAVALAFLFAMTLRDRKLLGETLWRAFDAGPLLHAAMVGAAVWSLRGARPSGR